MAMDGKELVEKLAKLSQVQSIKDIPRLWLLVASRTA